MFPSPLSVRIPRNSAPFHLAPSLGAALVALCAFGCATVRVPVGGLSGRIPADDGPIARPQVAVWVESDDAPDPGDRAKAEAEARAALERAVAYWQVVDAPGLVAPLMVVREQAVARTDSRKRAQAAAVAGIVVGAVVVVAVVIAAASSGKGGRVSLPSGGGHAAGAAGHAGHAAGAVAGAVARAHPIPRWGPPAHGWRAPAYPWWRHHCCGLHADLYVPIGPVEPAPPVPPGDDGEELFFFEGPAPEDAPAAVAAPAELELPPAEPLPLDDRGFFSRDEVQLQVDLLDRDTGRLLWTRTVREEADSSDGGDVHRLLATALEGQPWARPVPRLASRR